LQGGIPLIVPDLPMQVFAQRNGVVSPLNGLDGLLGSKCDENAEHNDPDLAGELAPAVQWLRQLNMHVGNAPEITEA